MMKAIYTAMALLGLCLTATSVQAQERAGKSFSSMKFVEEFIQADVTKLHNLDDQISEAERSVQLLDQEISRIEDAISTFEPTTKVVWLTAVESSAIDRGGCFLAGTPVLMADGTYKPIETINAGDMVMSFDPVGHLTPNPVEARIVTPEQEVVAFDGVYATPKHPFLTPSGKLVQVKDLAPGDQVILKDGSTHTIGSVMPYEGKHTVHNLIVKNFNTYVAAGFRVGGYVADGIDMKSASAQLEGGVNP